MSTRFFTPERLETLAQWSRRSINYIPAEPAKLNLQATTLSGRESAYAYAITIMRLADEAWKEEAQPNA